MSIVELCDECHAKKGTCNCYDLEAYFEREVCGLCEGDGSMTNEDYEAGDCPACEGTGYISLSDH